MRNLELEMSEIRSLYKWKKDNIEYQDINDFIKNFQPVTAIHTVWAYEYPIDILLDYTPEKPTVFIWKGNTRRRPSIKMPIFVGFSMIKKSDATRISISDPTMYLNDRLGLAWYAGSPSFKFQNTITSIVKHIGNYLKGKIVHTGGSGGGFAALYYSKINKGSLAIPFNPQVNFLDYEVNAVKHYLKSTIGTTDIEEAKRNLSKDIIHDLRTIYSPNDVNNYVIYLQNIHDAHVAEHLVPFLTQLNVSFNASLGLHLYEELNTAVYLSAKWGDGHNPPPSQFLSTMLQEVLAFKGGFSELVRNTNFLYELDESMVN